MFEHCVVSTRSSSANTSKASGGGAGRLALADLYMSRMDANRCFKIYTRHGIPGHPYGSFPFVDAVITRHLSASTVGYFQYKIDRAHLWPAVRRPFCGLYPYVPRHSRRCVSHSRLSLLAMLLYSRLHSAQYSFSRSVANMSRHKLKIIAISTLVGILSYVAIPILVQHPSIVQCVSVDPTLDY